MSVNTNNIYGKISISDEAIARVAEHAALDCYGIVELVNKRFTDNFSGLFKKGGTRGVKVTTDGDRIHIDLYVMVKFGVSISAVAESLKQAVNYNVEKFTGMLVDTVNVNVVGVKL